MAWLKKWWGVLLAAFVAVWAFVAGRGRRSSPAAEEALQDVADSHGERADDAESRMRDHLAAGTRRSGSALVAAARISAILKRAAEHDKRNGG